MIEIVLLSLMTAALSVFAEECMQSGMILRRYRLWLLWHWINMRHYQHRPWRVLRPLLKPAGLCIYCYGSWVYIVLFTAQADKYTGFYENLLYLSYGLGLNYVWIKIIEKGIK